MKPSELIQKIDELPLEDYQKTWIAQQLKEITFDKAIIVESFGNTTIKPVKTLIVDDDIYIESDLKLPKYYEPHNGLGEEIAPGEFISKLLTKQK